MRSVLRTTPDGAIITADADGDILRYVASRKEWETTPLPTPPSGLEPLVETYWVDSGRVGSTEDGSIGQPYLTIQGAIDALAALPAEGVVIIAEGDYSLEDLAIGANVSLFAYQKPSAADPLSVNSITASNAVVRLENVGALSIALLNSQLSMRYGFANTVALDGEGGGSSRVLADFSSFGAITADDTSGNLYRFRACSVESVASADGSGSLTAYDCTFSGAILASDVELWNTFVSGNITAVGVRLYECPIFGLVTLDPGGTHVIDSFTLNALRNNGFAHVLTPLTISDRPYFQLTLTVPALVAAFEDVTSTVDPTLLTKPGDTFSVAMGTSVGDPRLDDVAAVAAWCDAENTVTVRFFGTTAGGDQVLDLNKNTNSG